MADAAGNSPATRAPAPVPVPIRALPGRGRALCHGFIESVTYAPAGKVASFNAVVIDQDRLPGRPRAAARPQRGEQARRPGRLRVIWLGRRRIPGIEAGTELNLEGMVTVRDGLPTMFNPRYEILSRQEEQ